MLGDNPQPTIHKKIKKAQDPFVPLFELEKQLTVLKSHLANNKAVDVKMMLENILSSYQSEYKIVDYQYIEQAGLTKDDVKKSTALSLSNKVININK